MGHSNGYQNRHDSSQTKYTEIIGKQNGRIFNEN